MHPISFMLSRLQRTLHGFSRAKEESATILLGLFIVWTLVRRHRAVPR